MDELKYKSNINIDDSSNEMIDFPILLIITADTESPEIVSSMIIVILTTHHPSPHACFFLNFILRNSQNPRC